MDPSGHRICIERLYFDSCRAKYLRCRTLGGCLPNVVILVGNTEYRTLGSLACCGGDLAAIQELLETTGKFQIVEVILNQDSSQLKDRIRSTVDAHSNIEEIFFYFTGHGYQNEADFFFCATNFDAHRPNETGLSSEELHTFLRPANADLVVKIIDACSSGALLFKADGSVVPISKQGFKNVIQIASCLDSQSSLAGDPLSLFTEKFVSAALRKTEGTVYYTDIIDALRDEFLNNNSQTPHFVSQGTGREYFVENAKRLDAMRAKLFELDNETEQLAPATSMVPSGLTPLAVLESAEKRFAKKDRALAFISDLFTKVSERAANEGLFGDLFQSEIIVHPDFREPTTRSFIIRVLKGEKRPDNFVTAAISRQHGHIPFGIASVAAMLTDSVADYDLELNCSLDQAQLKLTLTPRFISLKMFVLVITCAPSLEICYVFEMLSQHSLLDWGQFDSQGSELVRRWYKKGWTESPDKLVDQIFAKLHDAIQENVDSTAKILAEEASVSK